MPTVLDEIKANKLSRWILDAPRLTSRDEISDRVAELERWAVGLAKVARALPEHVDLTEFLESHDADLPRWALQFHWCLFCGYKEPDGHFRDCPMDELRRILAEQSGEAADE